jgi:hypothetical protein
MKIFPRSLFMILIILPAVFILSCRQQDEEQPPPSGGDGVAQGMTRLYGTVRDAAGQPVSNVALHVVYDFSGASASRVMTPSSVFFFDTLQVLTTTCDGSDPLPDGIPVEIFWDVDGDGPDDTDPQPPLCDNPPDCLDGPAHTVNYNEFLMNGEAMFGVPGTFAVDRDFQTVGDVLSPNRFYLRIFCSDGNVLWESEVVDVPSGPSERQLHQFLCHTCSGIPEVPVWSLSQCYPNPTADSITINYGLQEAAPALMTLREVSRNRLDTLLSGSQTAGNHVLVASLGHHPNGLYEYQFSAPAYSQSRRLLKNETDTAVLGGTSAIDISDDAGAYRFDTAGGITIDRRGSANENLGTAALDHVHIIAIKAGYQVADTMVTAASAESLNVDITLRVP